MLQKVVKFLWHYGTSFEYCHKLCSKYFRRKDIITNKSVKLNVVPSLINKNRTQKCSNVIILKHCNTNIVKDVENINIDDGTGNNRAVTNKTIYTIHLSNMNFNYVNNSINCSHRIVTNINIDNVNFSTNTEKELLSIDTDNTISLRGKRYCICISIQYKLYLIDDR